MTVPHPLDNPVLSSLTGPHARFAERQGNVLRYPADVCPFVAMPGEPDEGDWTATARLAGPGGWVRAVRSSISGTSAGPSGTASGSAVTSS